MPEISKKAELRQANDKNKAKKAQKARINA